MSDPVSVFNTYAGTIPPWGAMEIQSGTGYVPGEGAYLVGRPSEDSLNSSRVVFNGATRIAESGRGMGYMNPPCAALFSGDTPAVGDTIGTESGSFTLSTAQSGLRCIGVEGAEGRCRVSPFSGGSGLDVETLSFTGIPNTITFSGIPQDSTTITRRTDWYPINNFPESATRLDQLILWTDYSASPGDTVFRVSADEDNPSIPYHILRVSAFLEISDSNDTILTRSIPLDWMAEPSDGGISVGPTWRLTVYNLALQMATSNVGIPEKGRFVVTVNLNQTNAKTLEISLGTTKLWRMRYFSGV